MRKLLAALGLLGGLWASNVTATILSYDITVNVTSDPTWSVSNPTPFGIASQPTFSGTLQVNNAYSGSAALVGFNMVTGSQTWTEKSLVEGPAAFWFDSTGNLSGWYTDFRTGSNWLHFSTGGFQLTEVTDNGAVPIPSPIIASATCSSCVSLAPTSKPVVSAPTNYGLFIGALDPGLLRSARFDTMANRLADAFDALPNTTAYRLIGDLTLVDGKMVNPVTAAAIEEKLRLIRSQMNPGDSLTIYLGGHGGSVSGANDLNWLEGKLSSLAGYGDEAVSVGQLVWDNWLANQLSAFESFRKTIFIEACHSGGFWGSGDSTELLGVSDLDQLKNIALYTSASERNYSWSDIQGLGFWGLALEDAFGSATTLTGDALADFLESRSKELASGPKYSYPYYFSQALGDAFPADVSLISSEFHFSADFDRNSLLIASVPEPGTLSLLALALVGLGASRRRRQ